MLNLIATLSGGDFFFEQSYRQSWSFQTFERNRRVSTETEPLENGSPASKIQTESHLRSFMKALSWRIIATLTTIVITWFFTGQVSTALKVGAFEFVLKFIVYYLHERAWQLVPRGTIRKMLAS